MRRIFGSLPNGGQKNDRRDADLILELLVSGDFPRIHRCSAATRQILQQSNASPTRGHAKAKVAVGRQLLVRTFIMLRDEIDYDEFLRRGVAARSVRGSA